MNERVRLTSARKKYIYVKQNGHLHLIIDHITFLSKIKSFITNKIILGQIKIVSEIIITIKFRLYTSIF